MPYQSFIELANVSKQYSGNGFAGLKDVSCSIGQAEVIAIVGESGSGKSTLLKIIYGLLSPDQGSVFFRQEQVAGPDLKLIPGHDSMKMVTQDFSLNTYAKVYDNVASMLPNTNLRYKEEKSWEIMRFLKIDHLFNKRVSDLSGGEQQRVAVARAIITEPEVLLMDEPFSQIDTPLKSHLRADIKRLSHDLGITVILVSHDPIDGLSLADQIFVLRAGELVESGEPLKVYNNPAYAYTSRLLADSNILVAADALKIGLQPQKALIGIYPQWIHINRTVSTSINYKVVNSFFKGTHEELVLEYEGIRLRAINSELNAYQRGSIIPIVIEKFIEFDSY